MKLKFALFDFRICPLAITCILKPIDTMAIYDITPGVESSRSAEEGHIPMTAVSEYHDESSWQKFWRQTSCLRLLHPCLQPLWSPPLECQGVP